MMSSIRNLALLSTLLPCVLSSATPALNAVAGVAGGVSAFKSEAISSEGAACLAMAESFPRLKEMEGIPLLGKTVWVKGEEWSGSLSTKPYWCNFYGVTCGGTVPGTASYVSVTSINLESCQMIGELPASIGDFRNLDFFSVGGNYVTGTIPETIGAWNKNMDSVKFFDNSIRGTIPAALGALTGLSNLHLDQNYITGPIPFFLRELTKLKIMHLYDNSLTGPIPEWIGGLNALTRIYWDSNYLTGTIPDSVGDLLSLEYLHLFSNSLVGSIPSSLEMLSNLTELSLYGNQLVGTIPSLAALSKLFLLDLHSNTLTMGGLDKVPSSLFSELTNEGPMNLSLNCLNYPARAFYPAPSCGIVPQPSLQPADKPPATAGTPTTAYPTRKPVLAKPVAVPSASPVSLSPDGIYASVSAQISQDFYFSCIAAPLTSADPEYWQFVKRVEFIVAGALSLAPEDAVSFVSLSPANATYPPVEGVTNVLTLTYSVVSKTGKSTKDLQSQALFAGQNGLYDVAITNAGLPYSVVTCLMSYDITSNKGSPTLKPIRFSSNITMSNLWVFTALFAVPIIVCCLAGYLGYRCRVAKKRKLMMMAKELDHSTQPDDMMHEGMYSYPPEVVKKVVSNEGPYMYPPERI